MRVHHDWTIMVLGLLTLMLLTLWVSTLINKQGVFYPQDRTGVQRLSIDQRLIVDDGAAYRS